MKLTATHYAKTLYELAKDKDEKEIESVISKFIIVLAKNNQLSLSEKIAEKFGDVWNRKKEITEAEVVSRIKLDQQQLEKVKNFINERYQAKEMDIKNKIDEKIKGGIIIKVKDDVYDGSVVRQIRELKKNLTK